MLDKPLITSRLAALKAGLGLAAIVALIALAVGYSIGHRVASADVADLKRQYAEEQAENAEAARQQLADAVARGDALSKRLAQAESTLNRKTLETSREIARLTHGRACLDQRVVRVLNNDQPASGVPAPAGASAATDGTAASDTDVAGWINHAQGRYGICRERLDALIDWERGK